MTTTPPEAQQRDQRVQYFELLFDLVFVFSLIQITGMITDSGTVEGVLRALVVLFLVWWVWVSFTSLANLGVPYGRTSAWLRVLFAIAMLPMLIVGMLIPYAFWSDSLSFAYSFAVLAVLVFIGLFATTRGMPTTRRALRRMLPLAALLPITLVLSAYLVQESWSVILIIVGLASATLAPLVTRVSDWPIAPAHLAERYALFTIITLGESIISIGTGATKSDITSPTLVIAIAVALVLVLILWALYYQRVLIPGEHFLENLGRGPREKLARFGYEYLHLAFVIGIILVAAALKESMLDVTAPLPALFETLLALGAMLFLLALLVFDRITGQPWRVLPILATVLLAVMTLLTGPLSTPWYVFLVAVITASALDPRLLMRSRTVLH